jgi:hypothetical protein
MDDLFLYGSRFLTLAAIFALLLGLPLRTRRMRSCFWTVAALGMLSYAVTIIRDEMSDDVRAYDLEYFWNSGNLMREGKSPYEQPNTMNPPSAFPLYWLVSSFSFDEARFLWTMLLAIGAATLVVFARRILIDAGDEETRKLEWPLIGVLTAVVCLSRSNRFGIELGQLALPITLCLFWAFLARLHGKTTQAGVGLAIASIKTPTLLPSLILFLRKREWKTWLVMGGVGLALVLSMCAPWNIPPRCQECLHNIAGTRERGKLDDYEIINSRNNCMIGFNLLFNRLGVEDRGTIALLHNAAQLLLGLWVAWLALRKLDTPAAMSVVAIFSMLFMYHRIYDLLLLSLPLTYAFGKARAEKGLSRWLFVACAGCLLLSMNIREWIIAEPRARVLAVQDTTSTLLRAFVLPYLTWLMLASLVLLVLAERARARVVEEADDESTSRVGLPRRLTAPVPATAAEGVG